jgi:hypothetical protein
MLTVAIQYGSCVAAQDLLHGWVTKQTIDALALVKVQERSAGITLSFRNTSGKTITAIAASSPPGVYSFSHFYDSLDSDSDGLPSGAIYDLKISTEEVSSSDSHALEINAVIFADDTAEGSRWDLVFMNAKRLGRVFETERLRMLLAGADAIYESENRGPKLRGSRRSAQKCRPAWPAR